MKLNVPGRIIRAVSGFYYVQTQDGAVLQCRARGVFKKRDIRPLVGDYVFVEPQGTREGIVTGVKPRDSELIRPPVANVDQVLLVFSLADPPLSFYQVDKMLAMIESYSLRALLGFTKVDLPESARLFETARAVYESMGYETMALNVRNSIGAKRVAELLSGHTTVLAGQSGVGKSTILGALLPDVEAVTGVVGERSRRGRHTTRHVELYPYAGGYVADTPGFSQFDFDAMEPVQLTGLFRDIAAAAEECAFRGCLHEQGTDCAVLRAVSMNRIGQSRYDSYRQLLAELKEAKARRY